MCHVPFDRCNPYQRLLAAAQREAGVSVDFAATLGEAAVGGAPGGWRRILHLHWLPRGFLGPRNLLEFARFSRGVRRFRRGPGTVIWTVHNLYAHESKNRRRERRLTEFVLRQCSGVIVHAPSAGRMLRREFEPARNKPVATIPHGNYIDCYPRTVKRAEARGRLGIGPDEPVVTFLGHIRRYKGVENLLRAFRNVAPPAARLVIAGRPADPGTGRLVRELIGRDPRILFFPGLVPDAEIQVYLEAADVVALPYLNVLTSGAAVLAMSFGKACVAPRSGCLPDMLSTQEEFLYDPADPNGLPATLERALGDPELVRACGARNLTRAAEWSWKHVAAQTIAFYRECVKHRQESGGDAGR